MLRRKKSTLCIFIPRLPFLTTRDVTVCGFSCAASVVNGAGNKMGTLLTLGTSAEGSVKAV